MKEISIEEKARRYDNAKYIMKEYIESGIAGVIAENTIRKAFPELKESEDERVRKELITHCRNTRCVTEEGAERIAKWIAWLEKQEQKPAWSEEDETVLGNLIYALANDRIGNDRDEYVDWLKSLRPQNTWRPSDEQIKVLEFFIPYVTKCSIVLEKSKGTLLSLLSDLKKLKG